MTALAIFVKTPGFSPVKTRLAQGIGDAAALEFYRLALDSVAEVAGHARSSLTPYWVVAEEPAAADPAWREFPTIWQGDGGLGDRLDRIYTQLQHRHGQVLLIGADSPQITAANLARAAHDTSDFVMGRAEDGGFWLFGGRRKIPASIWRGVPYSADDTADRLLDGLAGLGHMSFLPTLSDVDHASDLQPMAEALASLSAPTPAQQRLMAWITRLEQARPERT